MPKQENTWRIYVKRCYYKKLAILIVIVLTVPLLALFKGALIDIFVACKNSPRRSRNGFYFLRSEKFVRELSEVISAQIFCAFTSKKSIRTNLFA